MFRLSIEVSISAAHYLKEYSGACSRMHGHNWKIQVMVSSEQTDKADMVIDFKDLKDLTWQVVGKFGHQTINQIPPFDRQNPTAENLARHFYREIGRLLPSHVSMDTIRLWETEKYLLEYSE